MTIDNIQENAKMTLSMAKSVRDYTAIFKQNWKKLNKRISTGFRNLDMILNGGLQNELYILAAQSSVGKSTFAQNIAHNLAKQGTQVLYIALEMGQDELFARGVSELSFLHNQIDPSSSRYTVADLIGWKYDTALDGFARTDISEFEFLVDEYGAMMANLKIIEGGPAGKTAAEIVEIAQQFKAMHQQQPLVLIIDYLQLIKAMPGTSDRKTNMDTAITRLKSLASQYGMPVIAISSVGRSKYDSKVSMDGLKESGDIEYTAGVVLGLNWSGVTDEANKGKKISVIEQSKKSGWRTIEIEILKNRNGLKNESILFKYYPAYNHFEEIQVKVIIEGPKVI